MPCAARRALTEMTVSGVNSGTKGSKISMTLGLAVLLFPKNGTIFENITLQLNTEMTFYEGMTTQNASLDNRFEGTRKTGSHKNNGRFGSKIEFFSGRHTVLRTVSGKRTVI